MGILIATISIAIVGVMTELYLLDNIFTHPAGGWEGAPASTLLAYKAGATIPYLVLAVWSLASRAEGKRKNALRYSIFVTVIGIVLVFLGLRQYGHATPLFLFTGYVGQWVALAVGITVGRKK